MRPEGENLSADTSDLEAAANASEYTVTGTVTSPDSAGVGGLRVLIVDKRVGDDLLLIETKTDARGRYSIGFPATTLPAGKAQPDLQARVLLGEKLLAVSEVVYNAGSQVTLDVHLPAHLRDLPSEYETLTGALAAYYDGNLRDLQETEDRQDVTYLANKSGWDARAVAMAALADRLYNDIARQDPNGLLSPPFYYALLRAGLSADSETLHLTDVEAVEEIWKKAVDQGVIPRGLRDEIPQAKGFFQTIAAAHVLKGQAVPGTSTLEEMVQSTLGEEQRKRFAYLYARYRGNPSKFWEEVAKPESEGGLGAEVAKALQHDGQLACLTLNNAPLMDRLRGFSSPLALVEGGYYSAAKWQPLVATAPIPQQIPGSSEEEQRANYAEQLAAQVRLGFPTAVVGAKIKSGELPLPIPGGADAQKVRDCVAAFLAQQQGEFDLGRQPIEPYLESRSLKLHPDPGIAQHALAQIKRLQRIYQITPTDQAMKVLLESRLDSAYQIVGHEEEEFVALFKDKLGGEAAARLIHAKAQQVHGTVLNLASSYFLARNAPGVGVGANGAGSPAPPPLEGLLGPRNGGAAPVETLTAMAAGLASYPTLEDLFGSMDFCACDHCRSILSPSAYLVDLLHFLDKKGGGINPLAELLERRPDIEHLPLTCENTNTPLPYIDLVNEALEHLVTHKFSMSGYTGHDTGAGASPEELLAIPQHVDEAAYDILKAALFPPPLPFHKQLETLRRCFGKLEVPLHEAMEVLRKDDKVGKAVRPGTDADYDWRDILMERLGLSRAESGRLTDRTRRLRDLIGLPPEATVDEVELLKQLSKAKAFARTAGISYEEIVDLLGTKFIGRLGPIILTDPAGSLDPCSFDRVEFRVSKTDGTLIPLRALHHVGLLRFIALWKKVGLTIEQTDQLILALYPSAELPSGDDDAANLERLDKGFLSLLPRVGVAFQVMERLKLAQSDLQALLACWRTPGGDGASHEWLARRLRLSVGELLLLIRVTGLDPFAAPDPPLPPVVRFLDLVESLRAASLQPVQVLYLIWNEDLGGKAAPDDGQITGLARSLRAGFAAIENDFAIADDPTGQIARARMALVYGGDATDFFFGLLEDKLRLEQEYSQNEEVLAPNIIEAAKGRIGYDPFRKRLSYSGILAQATCDTLKAVAGVSQQFKDAMDGLLEKSDQAVGPFFARYPELAPLHAAYAGSNDSPEKKRTALLASFLPELKDRRKRQQALAEVGAAARTDAAFAQAILDDKAVLPAAGDPGRSAVDDLVALERPGLSPGDSAPGTWNGYLEAPENGSYNVSIESTATQVALTLDGKTVKLEKKDDVWTNAGQIELKAGTLYPVTVEVEGAPPFTFRWQTLGRGWEVVPPRFLYAATLVGRLRSAYLRFLKAASLAVALKMKPQEIAHFARKGWLKILPVSGKPDTATVQALQKVLPELLGYALLKRELAPEDERLLAVLRDPDAVVDGKDLLLALTGWEKGSLTDLLSRFGLSGRADLSQIGELRRVHAVYVMARKLGVPVSALLKAVTNEPVASTVRDLQSALRARYDKTGWLALIRSINDELRELQRDALVAYVDSFMAAIARQYAESRPLDTRAKLFEYLLMDVEVAPCVQTSRIRHALSSVQLFVDRCLMNLESVRASAINARQWEWMKRYRVWEANRKVFLWPENWLEPELRDDQSPFFKEIMGELLQGDVTEDRAATALLDYLSKLEDVAKLEPCGIHFVENKPGDTDDVAHVVARTAGARRKYYYRRREGGSWTPWEPIQLDIEDNPVIPVFWKNRLFLFWIRILKKGPETPQVPGAATPSRPLAGLDIQDIQSTTAAISVHAVLCWSEHYNGKWQPAKTSDVERPTLLGRYFQASSFDRSRLYLTSAERGGALEIGIGGLASFRFYNTHSLPVRLEDLPPAPYIPPPERLRFVDSSAGTFSIGYGIVDSEENVFWEERPILKSALPQRIVEPGHPLQDPWTSPFFFEDSRHVFYVKTAQEPPISSFGFSVQATRPSLLGVPPLALPDPVAVQERQLSVPRGPHPAVADPAPMERFISEDAYIRTGLGTVASVRYGGREIGPAGALSKRQPPQS